MFQHAGHLTSTRAVGYAPDGSRMAPDIQVFTDHKTYLIDVTMHNPLAAMRMDEPHGDPLRGCTGTRACLAAAAQGKLDKYAGLVTANIEVVAFAVSPQGGVGEAAARVMSLAMADRTSDSDRQRLSDLFQRAVSCAIVRGNAAAFRSFNEPVRRASAEAGQDRVQAFVDRWVAAQVPLAPAAVPAGGPAAALGGDDDGAASSTASEASSGSR